MAELQPLLNHWKFFMKCIFCTKFFVMHYTADFSMHHYAGFSKIGSHLRSFLQPIVEVLPINLLLPACLGIYCDFR